MINDIIKTYGLFWLLVELFKLVCTFIGFVLFPAIITTWAWNSVVAPFVPFFREAHIFAGILLWGIIAISIYITCGDKFKLPNNIVKNASFNQQTIDALRPVILMNKHWMVYAFFSTIFSFMGYVISPAFIIMYFWNRVVVPFYPILKMNLFVGVVLWGIIFIAVYPIARVKLDEAYKKGKGDSRAQFQEIIRKARKEGISLKMLKSRMPKRKR